MKFKNISKNAFVLLSLLFVIERSFRCIEKFIEKPQAVEIKMSDGVDEMLPHFTFCAEEKYNQTLVEECGFEFTDFAKGKIKLVGKGPEYCKNPRTVMEKAKIQLNEMIERVAIQFDNLNKVWIYPKDQSFWKYSDVYTSRTFGSCYTFFIPDSFERPISINNLRFRMKSNVSWMVHSLGSINRKENYQYNISEYNLQKYKINFEVYHMLDYNNYVCKNEPYYDRDSCTDDLVFKESMEKINCTLPFLQNKCHICNEQHSVTMVQPFAKNLTKGSRCENPCSYIKAAGIPIQQRKSDYNLLLFFFPESIRVHKAYYAYDELSLIAEIGGYVGLFLGWSFYQVIDVIEFSVESLKRKL